MLRDFHGSLCVADRLSAEALAQEVDGRGMLAVFLTPDGKVVRWYFERSTGKSVLDVEIKRVPSLVDQLDYRQPLKVGEAENFATGHQPLRRPLLSPGRG